MIHDTGSHKGYHMHVRSTTTMVNPLRIGRCDQKETIGGSEIGADIMAAAGSF